MSRHARFLFQQVSKINRLKKTTFKHGKKYNTQALLETPMIPTSLPRDPSKIKILPDEEMQHFRSFLPLIMQDITNTNLITDREEVRERLKVVLDHNITKGKQIRPALLIAGYKFILGREYLTEEEFKNAALIAWCIEMISSFVLMMDDIIDNSETRRGDIAWFKLENVGLKAINDGILLQMSVFKILKKYFVNHEHYNNIVNVFVEVILKTMVGQVMDCESWCIEKSTMDRFNNIAYNKTGYYTFYFPLMTAMFIAKRPDLVIDKEVYRVFMELGRFYQVQNDFLDVYGESYSGKVGTDIQEGKYSWLIIKALELATPAQREVLRNCYGKWNNECVQRVKNMYEELDLKNTYDDEVDSIYQKVLSCISEIESEVARELMYRVTRVCLGYDFHLQKRISN